MHANFNCIQCACIPLQSCTATKDPEILIGVANRSARDTIEEEFKRYMLEPQNNWRVNDVMQWWSDHEANFPHIALLALKYLAIPASSAPSEREFSQLNQNQPPSISDLLKGGDMKRTSRRTVLLKGGYMKRTWRRTVLLKGGDMKRTSRQTALIIDRNTRTIQLPLKRLNRVGIGMTPLSDWLNVLPRGRGTRYLDIFLKLGFKPHIIYRWKEQKIYIPKIPYIHGDAFRCEHHAIRKITNEMIANVRELIGYAKQKLSRLSL